jgi:hypothetical protein
VNAVEFQPVSRLSEEQVHLYAQAMSEIAVRSEVETQLKLRDMEQVVRDFRRPDIAERTLVNLRGVMQEAEDSYNNPDTRDFYVVTRDQYPIGMASRTSQPLMRYGAQQLACTNTQMKELGLHVRAWVDPARKTVDSAATLASVYSGLQFAEVDNKINHKRVPVWTIEPEKVDIKGPRHDLFMHKALFDAGLKRNDAQPVRYASAYTTRRGPWAPKHHLYHSNSILSFEPGQLITD